MEQTKIKHIGIDVGGTKIYAARYDSASWNKEADMLLCTRAEEGFETVIEDIQTMVNELQDEHTKGVGIGLPGFIDHNQKKVYYTPNIELKEPVCLQDELGDLGLPFCVDNDVNMIGLAERKLNYKDESNLLIIAMGTGVGGGIILDGEIFRGADGFASEFGHMIISKAANGDRLSFEQLCSGTAIKQRAGMRGIEIAELAYKQDEKALDFYDAFGADLGVGIANLIHAFDPGVIVLGGSVSRQLDLFGKKMWETIKVLTKKEQYQKLKIVAAKIENAGAVGAAILSSQCNK